MSDRMADLARRARDILTDGLVRRERACVTFTIPGSHPKADTLRAVAAELAHQIVETRGGKSRVTERLYIPGAEDRLMQTLRDIVGGAALDALMANLQAQQKRLDDAAMYHAVVEGFNAPDRMAKIVLAALEAGVLKGSTEQHDMIRLGNKADAQARTGEPIMDHATTEVE